MSRWIKLDETSPSGKTLFRCVICERVSPTPDKACRVIGDPHRRCDEIEAYFSSRDPMKCPECKNGYHACHCRAPEIYDEWVQRVQFNRCGGCGEVLRAVCPRCNEPATVRTGREIQVDVPGALFDGKTIRTMVMDPDCAECEKPAQWEKLHKELREEKIEHRHSLTVSADSRNRLYKDLDQARRTMRKVAKRLRHRANARTWRDDGAVSVSTNELLELADRLDKPSSADQEAAQSAPTPPELRGS